MPDESSTLEVMEPEAAAPRRRFLRRHAFVALAVVGVLVGGGLRFVPNGAAAPASSGGAATACAAP